MPITGLPVILETSISALMQESTVSSFKIVSNRNGAATVIMKFSSITSLASDKSKSSPRVNNKSPGQVRRDKQRRSNFYNSMKRYVVSNTLEKDLFTSWSPCSQTVVKDLNTTHSAVEICSTPLKAMSTNSIAQSKIRVRRAVPTCPFTVYDKDVWSENKCLKTTNLPCDKATQSNQTCEESTFKSSNAQSDPKTNHPSHIQSLTPPYSNREAEDHCFSEESDNLHNSEHSKFLQDSEFDQDRDCNIFRSNVDYSNALRCTDDIPCTARRNIEKTLRNTVIHRIAIQEDDRFEGGKAYILETDDLLYQFFPHSKTIGHVCVLSGVHMKRRDKLFDSQFLQLPQYDIDKSTSEWRDVKYSLHVLTSFIQRIC